MLSRFELVQVGEREREREVERKRLLFVNTRRIEAGSSSFRGEFKRE